MRDTTLSALCDDLVLLVDPMGVRPQRWLTALIVLLGAFLLSMALNESTAGSNQADRAPELPRAVAALEPLPPSF